VGDGEWVCADVAVVPKSDLVCRSLLFDADVDFVSLLLGASFSALAATLQDCPRPASSEHKHWPVVRPVDAPD